MFGLAAPSRSRVPRPGANDSEEELALRRHVVHGGVALVGPSRGVAKGSLGASRTLGVRDSCVEMRLTFMMPRGPQGPAVSLTEIRVPTFKRACM